MMMCCSCIISLRASEANLAFPTKTRPPPSSSSSSSPPAAATFFGLTTKKLDGIGLTRSKSQAFRVHVTANSQASRRKRSSGDDVIMVDPLEAKRLAVKQMQEIQAKQKLKRQRRIEAINGAWAMIGLTAGLVIEGQTGHSILEQLAGYWAAIIIFFSR